ncbi:MAG TPA: glycosyltransferase family 4 protein [Bacillota bacterium]|nr:glycosyltransferase family 4 protein [Bacillota bacterium]
MISFVWSSAHPFLAGAGGSENYTAGQIRELKRRGIPTRILTLGYGEQDGRDDFPDIEFKALKSKAELSELDDTLVFVTYPLNVPTKRPAYAILHCPPTSYGGIDELFDLEGMKGKQLLVPSKFAAKLWKGHLGHHTHVRMPAVYPFAEPVFSQVKRPHRSEPHVPPKILFANRLIADKGIYTLLASLHLAGLRHREFELTVTTAGAHCDDGRLIQTLLEAHPRINVVPSCRTPKDMARLMAEHDIAVMPSTDIFWKEIFGISSVEAQHAGCRVVASNTGGLPETDCGGLMLVKPDDPLSLANGLARAMGLGPLTEAERLYASTKFTVASSVDRLLRIIQSTESRRVPRLSLQKQGALVREQLDTAFKKGIMQLGAGMAGDNKLAYRRIS